MKVVSKWMSGWAGAVLMTSLLACGDAAQSDTTDPAGTSLAPVEAPRSPKFRPARHGLKDRYIVVLREDVHPTEGAQRLGAKHGAKAGHLYSTALHGFSTELPEAAARRLSEDAEVLYVAQDLPVTLEAIQSSPTWALDRIDQPARPLNGAYEYKWTGAGVNAYVIDSGIRFDHQEFLTSTGGTRARHAVSFVPNDTTGVDCFGHGTHVAGILGGNRFGVAKNVNLFSVRVTDCTGSGRLSDVVAALDWIAANHVRPAVVNMSISFEVAAGDMSALETAVRNVHNRGVLVVAAAGNQLVDACTRSPARVSEALTVAASTSDDSLWVDTVGSQTKPDKGSNYGSCVDLFAPGRDVTSSLPDTVSSTASWSGTSMATPHVAGAAALYLQIAPTASPALTSQAILGETTRNVLVGLNGSPNRLLFMNPVAPPAPGGLTSQAQSPSQVLVWWSASTVYDAAGYQVFRDGSYLGYTTNTLWSDNGASSNTTHRYSVRAYNWFGQTSGDSGSTWATTPVSPSSAVPFHRYWSPYAGDHFYTLGRNDSLYASYGYSYEGIEARVLPQPWQGAVPIHRYWSPGWKDHYYTLDRDDAGLAAYGYNTYEGIEGYAYRDQRWGTVPLYRYYSSSFADHLFTLHRDDAGYAASGWNQYQGITGYVYPK
jgi:subtilisin family serine protease